MNKLFNLIGKTIISKNVCIFSGTENDIFTKLENYIILD